MAWTSDIVFDDDKIDVGRVTCIWNAGQADEFRYSRRAQMTNAEKVAIAAEAKAALTEWQDKRATEVSYENLLTTELNLP